MPRIHHFTLTNDKGRKVYGTCLTFYEEYHPNDNTPYSNRSTVLDKEDGENIEVTVESTKGKALYIPKVLCILSTWAYLTAFREYLSQLYRLATTTNLMQCPVERHILNLCSEIPAPPPGAFEVHVSILTSTIKFWAPPAKLPLAYVALPFETLFECLEPDNILTVWYALVLEHKVLLVSSQHSILTVCAEILCALLFPLQWSHLYIPLLPKFLSPMLDAPVPYLVGVGRENWISAKQNLNEETIVVDLDTNEVTFGRYAPPFPTAPTKKWGKLKAALEEGGGEVFWKTRGLETEYRQMLKGKMSVRHLNKLRDSRGMVGWKEKLRGYDDAFNLAYTPDSLHISYAETNQQNELSRWEKVQESFLRFFVSTLKSYRKFLHITEPSPFESPDAKSKRWTNRKTFDREGYVAWQKPEHQEFYNGICMTQQFDDFVTKRMYSPGEPDVIFFDQSIDAKLNRSRLKIKKVETPFLQSAKVNKVLKTIKAIDPNEEGLPIAVEETRSFVYPTWPDTFDSSLFGSPRPIPPMITAEFDRQSSLVGRLRASYSPAMLKENLLADFYCADYDPSPEVATFTVFFFTYCAIVGLEWEAFQQTKAKLESDAVKALEEQSENEREREQEQGDEREPPNDQQAKPVVPAPQHQSIIDFLVDDMKRDVEGALGLDCNTLSTTSCKQDCEVCPNGRLQNDEFLVQWSTQPFILPAASDASSPRETSLLDFDDQVAEYEEVRQVAAAQLELAFEVLNTMTVRGLPTDADAFKSLMAACGRCGNTDRAVELIEIMKRDGFVADSEIYSCFVHAFAQDESVGVGTPSRRGSDAYSAFLTKQWHDSRSKVESRSDALSSSFLSSDDDLESDVYSESAGSDGSKLDASLMSDIYHAVFTPHKKKKKRRKPRKKRRSSVSPLKHIAMPVTPRVDKQVVLGDSLLEYLYANVRVDTQNEVCPQCSAIVVEDDIVSGWLPCEFEEHTTCCPVCHHRFVPHFTVKSSSPTFEGSQGLSTPLYCEYLSPWVLRKELEHILNDQGGVQAMLSPAWRSGTGIHATLWWNLIVAFNRYRLPVSFLLQGSFQNRLINPTPDI